MTNKLDWITMIKIKDISSILHGEINPHPCLRRYYEITLFWCLFISYTSGKTVIRLCRLAISIKDSKQHSLCFSERNGIKCIKIGKYIIRSL